MDLRRILALSVAGGLALACAASLALAGRPQARALEQMEARLAAFPARIGSRPALSPALTAPKVSIFPVLDGPDAPPDIPVRLEGVARSPGRIAALLAVGGGPAGWLRLGETRDGVTLTEVGSATVTVDTARGPKIVGLGSGSASPANPLPVATDAPPPGLRSPPEPASAPGADVG